MRHYAPEIAQWFSNHITCEDADRKELLIRYLVYIAVGYYEAVHQQSIINSETIYAHRNGPIINSLLFMSPNVIYEEPTDITIVEVLIKVLKQYGIIPPLELIKLFESSDSLIRKTLLPSDLGLGLKVPIYVSEIRLHYKSLIFKDNPLLHGH